MNYHVSNVTKTKNGITYQSNGTWAVVRLYRKLLPGTYAISADISTSDSGYARCEVYKEDTSLVVSVPGTFTLTEETIVNIRFVGSNATTSTRTVEFSNIQLELASSASAFEAYQGTTAQYEFPQEAGTVYGGTLTIHQDGSGELVVDRASVEYDGSPDEIWGEYGIGTTYYCCVSYPTGKALGNQKSICNRFKNQNAAYGSGEYGIYCDHPSLVNTYFRMPNAEITTKQGFLAWIAQNPIQLVYELATPVTYQLTNQQVIALLKGSNNLWSTTGDVAVEYPADTKLYIDGKVAELQALILENISNS